MQSYSFQFIIRYLNFQFYLQQFVHIFLLSLTYIGSVISTFLIIHTCYFCPFRFLFFPDYSSNRFANFHFLWKYLLLSLRILCAVYYFSISLVFSHLSISSLISVHLLPPLWIYVLEAINFSVSTNLVTFQKFSYVVFLYCSFICSILLLLSTEYFNFDCDFIFDPCLLQAYFLS